MRCQWCGNEFDHQTHPVWGGPDQVVMVSYGCSEACANHLQDVNDRYDRRIRQVDQRKGK